MKNFIREVYSTTMYRFRMGQSLYLVVTCIIMISIASVETVSVWLGAHGIPLHGFKLFILLVFTTTSGFLLLGFVIYDVFKLWRVEIRVTQERNPFYWGQELTPSAIIAYKCLYLPLIRKLNDDGSLDETEDIIEHWVMDGNMSYKLGEANFGRLDGKMKEALGVKSKK